LLIDVRTGHINIRKGKTGLRFVFAGDYFPRGNSVDMILSGKTDDMIQPIKPFLYNKDLSMVNYEAPITNSNDAILKTGPNLKAAPGTQDFVIKAGFDIVGLSNNHIRDFGDQPVLETIKTLEGCGLKTTGAGKNLEESKKPLFINKNGLKIAVIAISENEFGNAGEEFPGGAPIDPVDNIAQIKEVSKETDLTIVYIHGGTEYLPVPNPRITQLYKAYAAAGASAVIAMHTHCPQGVEIYNGVPIVYSMGNFLFSKISAPYDPEDLWWKGYLVAIDFDFGGNAISMDLLPYTFGPDGTKFSVFKDEVATEFYRYIQFISDLVVNLNEQRKLWEAWCAVKGPGMANYFKNIRYPAERSNELDFRTLLTIRNLFTCEAHNDLNKTFFRLIEAGKVNEAALNYKHIETLQKGKIYELL